MVLENDMKMDEDSNVNGRHNIDIDEGDIAPPADEHATGATGLGQPKAMSLLKQYNTYGWKPDPNLSDDDNYMDLVMVLTRNSKLRQGSMACLLVAVAAAADADNKKGDEDEDAATEESEFIGRIISASTNRPFYNKKDSDIHAEISALGLAASTKGVSTRNASAYITMPPCKRCLVALHAANITRIVSRVPPPKVILEGAEKHGIKVVTLGDETSRRERINALVRSKNEGGDRLEHGNGKRGAGTLEEDRDPKQMREV